MKQSDVDPLDPLLLFLWVFLPRPQLADVDLANVAWSFVTVGLSGSVPPNFVTAAEDFWVQPGDPSKRTPLPGTERNDHLEPTLGPSPSCGCWGGCDGPALQGEASGWAGCWVWQKKLGHLAALRSLRSLGRWDWEHSQAAPCFWVGTIAWTRSFSPIFRFPRVHWERERRCIPAVLTVFSDVFEVPSARWTVWPWWRHFNWLANWRRGRQRQPATVPPEQLQNNICEYLWQYLLRYCGRSPTQLPSSLSSLLSFFQQYWEHLHLQNPAQKNHHQPATWVYQLLYPHHIPIINSINLVLIYEMLGSRSYHHYHLHKCI